MAVHTEPMQRCLKCSVLVNLQVELIIGAVSFLKYRQVSGRHVLCSRQATDSLMCSDMTESRCEQKALQL